MKKLSNIRNRILIFLSVVFVSLGGEIRNKLPDVDDKSFLYLTGIIIASLILVTVASVLLTKLMFGWRAFRKLLLGNDFVEGFWYVKAMDSDKHEIFSVDSIISVTFNPTTHQYEASNFRIMPKGEELYTKSKAIYYDEDSGLFINRFVFGAGESIQNGIAFGEAFKKPGSNIVNRWDGVTINLESEVIFRQRAERIPDAEVKEYKKVHQNFWLNAYLMDRLRQPEVLENS